MATSKYDTHVDLTREDNSHTLMVELVGSSKRVLDVGCANGYLAEVLVGHGCKVSGVEYDPVAAEEARKHLETLVVGDLEQLDLVAELGEGRFDVIVFGDVLEHLRDPLPVLRQARALLAPGGYVVISIPNIAHGAVRLTLLQGRFDYRPLGLLDSTHIRFFTRDNLKALLHEAGFAATDFLRTTAGIFETELGLTADEVPAELVERVLEDPDATTYQFVVRAVRDDADWAVERMRQEFEERLEDAERRIAEVLADRDARLAAYHEQCMSRDAEIARLAAEVRDLELSKPVRAARRAEGLLGKVRGPGD